ncbi:MAG: sulfurtransferase [Betaproteobacteria bacterium]|nr:sulfurtransferase [Betaproteobacteria bacterium]
MNDASAASGFIVSAQWLADHLGDPGVVVLDATTHLLPRPVDPTPDEPYDVVSGRADFEKGHIPGAQFVDIDGEISDRSKDTHFMLPPPEQFAAVMARLGVGDDTLVVCYATAFHWWATRLWWMLRVFGHERAVVLDGGFQKWVADGRAVETGSGKARARQVFTARFDPDLVADRDDVLKAVRESGACVVNALRPEQHAGGGTTNYGRPGHITGSINVAASNVVRADNTFRPLDELRGMLADHLAKPEVITYCGGGIAASSITMLLTMFGHRGVRLYDASLSEWARDGSLPMTTAG